MLNLSRSRYWRCNVVGAQNGGKLIGKTIAVKDNIPVSGVPMMSGSRMLEDYVPDHDATVVSRILDAGGRITGKAVCEEWCFTATSCTAATGPVVNPHDQTRMALGSSSGSAALVRHFRSAHSCSLALRARFPLSRASRSLSERKRDYSQSPWRCSVKK